MEMQKYFRLITSLKIIQTHLIIETHHLEKLFTGIK